MSWMIAPPYAYPCASRNSSGVASGKRFSSNGLILVSHAESMMASCESTEYAEALAGEEIMHASTASNAANFENNSAPPMITSQVRRQFESSSRAGISRREEPLTKFDAADGSKRLIRQTI